MTREYTFINNLDPDFYEDDIATADQTWFNDYTPETKGQSMKCFPAWIPGLKKP